MSQEITTVFKHNGVEYKFDVRDADMSEKFENAVEKMREEEKNIQKAGKASEIIRQQCNMIKTFFDNCLGKGAGIALCTERSNISEHYDAYECFLLMVREQKDDVLSVKNTFAKYSNRQQWSAAEHKNKKP